MLLPAVTTHNRQSGDRHNIDDNPQNDEKRVSPLKSTKFLGSLYKHERLCVVNNYSLEFLAENDVFQ